MAWKHLLAYITGTVDQALLQRLYGPRLKGVARYGSCARGSEATASDIDLMVL
jgi:predicted nucleotidyltransferase